MTKENAILASKRKDQVESGTATRNSIKDAPGSVCGDAVCGREFRNLFLLIGRARSHCCHKLLSVNCLSLVLLISTRQSCQRVSIADPICCGGRIHRTLNIHCLTLVMLRLFFLSKAQGRKTFSETFKPCHVGIHWIALTGYSLMSTHMPWFEYFFQFLQHFVLAKLVINSTSVKYLTHSCLEISFKRVVRTYDKEENNLRI